MYCDYLCAAVILLPHHVNIYAQCIYLFIYKKFTRSSIIIECKFLLQIAYVYVRILFLHLFANSENIFSTQCESLSASIKVSVAKNVSREQRIYWRSSLMSYVYEKPNSAHLRLKMLS